MGPLPALLTFDVPAELIPHCGKQPAGEVIFPTRAEPLKKRGGEDWSRVIPEDGTAAAKPPAQHPVTDASGRTSGQAQAGTRSAAVAPTPDPICQSIRAK